MSVLEDKKNFLPVTLLRLLLCTLDNLIQTKNSHQMSLDMPPKQAQAAGPCQNCSWSEIFFQRPT